MYSFHKLFQYGITHDPGLKPKAVNCVEEMKNNEERVKGCRVIFEVNDYEEKLPESYYNSYLKFIAKKGRLKYYSCHFDRKPHGITSKGIVGCVYHK